MASDLLSIIRVAQGRQGPPRAVVMDGRTLQSCRESGPRATYDGDKPRRGSKVHIAVDTLGHLLAVDVTPADEQKRLRCARCVSKYSRQPATLWNWLGKTEAIRLDRPIKQFRTPALFYSS